MDRKHSFEPSVRTGESLTPYSSAQETDDRGMAFVIPQALAAICQGRSDGQEWLSRLPETVRRLEDEWALILGAPFDGAEVSCSWVATAALPNGEQAVLKVGLPHFEGEQEIEGLRFWNGDPTVQLLEADLATNAMLLERCKPGTALRSLPEPEQDAVIAKLLRRLWRVPSAPHGFRHLSAMAVNWREHTLADRESWPDAGLVSEGLRLFAELAAPAAGDVLLATDLHAGNVLRAKREPWLVIDPKPFIGDPAYDATQHLFNCEERLRNDPRGTIERFADLLEVDRERVRLWTLARAAAEPRDDWANWKMDVARAISR